MEANKLINDLSVAEKIELYNCLYEDLSGKGIDGDTELAHVNVEEMAVLRAMGGSGTINPHTNLIQFGGGGGSPPPPPPATQTVTQQATIPEELKPFVTDVLEKARAIQERREVEGYVPFSGPRIAEFAPEQTQAFEQIKGLVGQGQQYFDPAARLTAASAFAPTAPQVSQFMNPYLQNVVDIQQREARRAGDIERQRLGAQAVGAGGFGGSRQAILEAEQSRNLQQQLGDIQARGLAAAYEDAQARLQQQRERERLAGAQFATLGQVAPGQAFRELSALEAIGAQRQQQQQQALDIAQQEYEIARTFPERTLQDYQSIIRGYAAPIPASTVQRSQTTTPAPSFLQQAAGLGGLALGAASAFKKEGGLVGLANGGSPATAASQGVSDNRPLEDIFSLFKYFKYGTSDPEKIKEKKEIREQMGQVPLTERTSQPPVSKGFGVPVDNAEREEYINEVLNTRKKTIEEQAELAKAKAKAPEQKDTQLPAQPPVSEPAFGDIRSLMASEKKIADALTKKYEGQAELLAKQKEDLGYGMADFAQGLLKFAAADPTKATTQQLAEAFSDLPEKAKEATIQKRAIELAESGLEADQAIALADRERGAIELQLLINKAEQGAKLDIKDAEAISNLALKDPDILPQLLSSVDKASQKLILQMLASKKGEVTSRVNQPKQKTDLLNMQPRTAASKGT